MLSVSRLAARACGARLAARNASSVVLLRDLDFSLNTEALLRGALEDADIRPERVTLKARASGRFNGKASLGFASAEDAAAAYAVIRKDAQKVGNRTPLCAWGPDFAEPPPLTEAEKAEDPLSELLRVVEERRLPTLDQIRSDLMENDQYDVLRDQRLPGLTWPEDIGAPPRSDAKERPQKEHGPAGKFAETIVKVDRVQKVVRGGTIMRYRALVVVGNLVGAGGFAFGKGHSPQDAVARASKRAKNELRFVDRYRGTALAHDVRGKHNNCLVDIYATPPGSAAVGGNLGRAILHSLGFSAFTIKARGRRSPYSYVRATFEALAELNSVEDIARKRGRRILEIEHALNPGGRHQ